MKKSVQTAIVREVEEVTTGNSNGNFCVVKPALLQSYTCPFASQNLPFCQDSRQFSTKVLTHKLYRNKRYNTYIKANNLHPQSGNWPWSPTLFTIRAVFQVIWATLQHSGCMAVLPNSWSPCFNTSRSWERYVLHIMSFIPLSVRFCSFACSFISHLVLHCLTTPATNRSSNCSTIKRYRLETYWPIGV